MAGDGRPIPPGGIEGWVDERLHTRTLMAALLHVRIPRLARTYYLGGITLFLFGVQVVTGTLLTLYYKPTPEAAYESVLFITSEVSFGWLIRSIHHWGAHLMILFLALHVVRIFFQAAFKYPRELTWVVGVGLLVVTIGFGFTGYLLPWDQRAFWATIVGTEIAGAVPLVGDGLLRLLRGGVDVTGATLSRFFAVHVLVLPLALGGLIAIHLTFVHQHGLANPKRLDRRPGEPPPAADDPVERTKPFFPHYLLDEVVAWYVVVAVLVVLASLFPAGLEEEANPLKTPAHVKPEWYFLAVYELLKHVPKLVGVLAPGVAILVLALLPLLDRSPEVRPRRRLAVIALGIVSIVVIVGLTARGYVS